MGKYLPKYELGKQVLNCIISLLPNYEDNGSRQPFRAFLRSELIFFKTNTANPDRVAEELEQMNILIDLDVERIKKTVLNSDKNADLYDIVFKKTAVAELICALENTYNVPVIKKLAKIVDNLLPENKNAMDLN